LSFGDVCDVVYALLAERVEARALAQYQASVAIAIASNGKSEVVDPDRQRQLFDEWLFEEIKPVEPEDRDRQELLRALGLR
jgi:AAA+ superfamily predicted ATPase